MKFYGIIPARFASTRFPGKPLAMINGKSMIMRVYEQASGASCFSDVLVATDDDRIFSHVNENGGKAIMTSVQHRSGTDRVFEATGRIIADKNDFHDSVIINIQGDEPFIDPAEIDRLAASFSRPQVSIATLIKKITSKEELFDKNVVKVIIGKGKRALYFSRTPLPFVRDVDASGWLSEFSFYKHIGIYAYRADILKEISELPSSSLEMAEGLEQLRWLENDYIIHTEETDYESISVDTPDDLLKFTNKD
ncbi:MAG: 3-deoxy-manno-octulosonate cytidylyltransferase [Bacteroidetes bacterium]|nr:3-deoxy-manno-octulosonate cytidylyltransferase [Bacteroidota bacterium]